MSSDTKFQLILCGVGLVLGLFAEALFGDYLKEKLRPKKEETGEYTTSVQNTEPSAHVPTYEEIQTQSPEEVLSDHNATLNRLVTDLLDAYDENPQEPQQELNETKAPPTYQEAKNYLQEMDAPDWDLPYDGKAVKNEHGYNLNHDGDKDFEWALGKDCDVFSYSEQTYGRWLVGKHTWIVIFGDERVAFSKKSLPKNISKQFIEGCAVS